MSKYKPKAREPRNCTECNKPLRKFYKSNEYVCAHPKVNKTQSQCQLDRSDRLGLNNQSIDTSGKRCKICDKVMIYKRNANQELCNRPKGIRYLFVDPKTPCQRKNQQLVEKAWKENRIDHPLEKTEEELIIEIIDRMWLPDLVLPPFDGKLRVCMGVLTAEDKLGHHTFVSAGPGNRICSLCVDAKEQRIEQGTINEESGNRFIPDRERYSE